MLFQCPVADIEKSPLSDIEIIPLNRLKMKVSYLQHTIHILPRQCCNITFFTWIQHSY